MKTLITNKKDKGTLSAIVGLGLFIVIVVVTVSLCAAVAVADYASSLGEKNETIR